VVAGGGRPAGPAGRLLIARGLAKLRERAGLTQVQLAEMAGCSKATVSRYEMWQDRARIKWATVKALADACGASAEERNALVELAKVQSAGWWVGDPAVPEWLDPLVSFEDQAGYSRVAANAVVPGLLQTPAYARALHHNAPLPDQPEDLEKAVKARMRRQEVLDRGLHLWVVLDEAVVRRVVGSDEIMAEQMAHLIAQAERPNVDLQILPFRSDLPSGTGRYTILGRDDERNPLNSMAVVYLELMWRGCYLDDAEQVSAYKLMFDRLRAQAVGASETLRLIEAAQREYRR
jgi:transcriptional regulator with XRE-family HTH domain